MQSRNVLLATVALDAMDVIDAFTIQPDGNLYQSLASGTHLDLGCLPYGLYGVKYIGLVSLAATGQQNSHSDIAPPFFFLKWLGSKIWI